MKPWEYEADGKTLVYPFAVVVDEFTMMADLGILNIEAGGYVFSDGEAYDPNQPGFAKLGNQFFFIGGSTLRSVLGLHFLSKTTPGFNSSQMVASADGGELD